MIRNASNFVCIARGMGYISAYALNAALYDAMHRLPARLPEIDAMTRPDYRLYGQYAPDEGYAIHSDCYRQLAKLQIYHLIHCLRVGERPLECDPEPPAGRTLIEFSTAASTPFHSRYFRDPSVPGHHREPGWLDFVAADRKRTRLNSSHGPLSRMPSSA